MEGTKMNPFKKLGYQIEHFKSSGTKLNKTKKLGYQINNYTYNFLYFFIWFFSSVPPSLSLVLFSSQFLPSFPYYFQNQITLRQNWRVSEHFGPNNFFFWV